jgi:hypothetical protein
VQQWRAGKNTPSKNSALSKNVNDTDLGIAVAQCGHVLGKEKGSQSLKPPNPNPAVSIAGPGVMRGQNRRRIGPVGRWPNT